MDYHRIYNEFIADRKAKPTPDGYTERHHILPRSLGGGDEAANLIALTARDHYFAHCCLAKMHGGKMWAALLAVAAMAKREDSWRYFCRRRMVEASRAKAAERRSEHMTHLWATGRFKRKREYRPWTEAEKRARSASQMGRRNSPASIEKARASRLASSPTFRFASDDGQVFEGTALAFREASGLSQSLVSYLTRGQIIWAKGWMLEGANRRAIRGRDPTVRTFRHKDGRTFAGTVYELRTAYPHLDCGSVSKMVNGKLGTVNGWKLIPPTAPSV